MSTHLAKPNPNAEFDRKKALAEKITKWLREKHGLRIIHYFVLGYSIIINEEDLCNLKHHIEYLGLKFKHNLSNETIIKAQQSETGIKTQKEYPFFELITPHNYPNNPTPEQWDELNKYCNSQMDEHWKLFSAKLSAQNELNVLQKCWDSLSIGLHSYFSESNAKYAIEVLEKEEKFETLHLYLDNCLKTIDFGLKEASFLFLRSCVEIFINCELGQKESKNLTDDIETFLKKMKEEDKYKLSTNQDINEGLQKSIENFFKKIRDLGNGVAHIKINKLKELEKEDPSAHLEKFCSLLEHSILLEPIKNKKEAKEGRGGGKKRGHSGKANLENA